MGPFMTAYARGEIDEYSKNVVALHGELVVAVGLRHGRRIGPRRQAASVDAGACAGRSGYRPGVRPERQGPAYPEERSDQLPGGQDALAAYGADKIRPRQYGEAIMNALEALQRDPNDKL